MITEHFIEYFTHNFNIKKVPPELDFNVKLYCSMFLSFIQYLQIPDTKILSFWNKQLKPFIKTNYPVIKNGIFTTNVDFEFIIKEIDGFNKPEKLIHDEMKIKLNERNKKNENNNTPTAINTKTNLNTNENTNSISNNNSNIKNPHTPVKNEKAKIFRPHSETIASDSTTDSYVFENNLINNIKEKNIKSNNDEYNKIIDKNIENPEIVRKKAINKNNNNNLNVDDVIVQKSKSEIVYKEMTQTFIDKDEIASKNIIYQPLKKTKIKLIDANLLLKKIVENDFGKKNYEILYAFIRQSFYFIKKDIFIKKIINCYRHYKKMHISIYKLINLINFLNAYIIELYLYYKSLIKDTKLLQLIKSFYEELALEGINNMVFQDINVDRDNLLKEKICVNIDKIDNSGREKFKDYSNKKVRQKLQDRVDRNRLKIIEMKKKQAFERTKTKKVSNILYNNDLQLDQLDDIDNNNDGRKTECFDPLNATQTFIPKNNLLNDVEKSPQKEFNKLKISDKNERNRSGSFKKSSKKIKKKDEEDKTNINEIAEIIGKDYEDIIKNNNLISSNEELLLNIKNMFKLFNLKNFKESEILIIKHCDKFYEKFPFYRKKDKKMEEIINEKKGKNIMQKCQTLNAKDIKINISQNMPKKCFCVDDWGVQTLGDKLTKIAINLLNKIEYKELYGALFTKNAKEINCPNVMENIKKFNSLIMFIIEDILSYDFPKDRARMIDKWVLVAQYCRNKRDQTNCFAIKSALSHYIITGLNLTFKEIKTKTRLILNELDDYCSLEGNYKTFREEIKNTKRKDFFVPYLGILLRDFTFFEENGKYLIQGNMINLDKIEKVQNSLDNFFKYKDSDPPKLEDNDELKFFENLETKTELELETLANQLEPEFKLRILQQKEKRLTQIDNKYFLNEFKRGSCLLNNKTMKISLK